MKPKGWKNEPGRHSLAARGVKTGRKIPTKVIQTINQDINEYLNTYVSGGLHYLLDDYGDYIKGYVRLPGSNQQIVEVKGKIIYDSMRDGDLTKTKFKEIIRKALDIDLLTGKKIYRVNWAEKDSRGTLVKDFGSKSEATLFLKTQLRNKDNIPARTFMKVIEK